MALNLRPLLLLGVSTALSLAVATAAEAGTKALLTTPGATSVSLEWGVGRAVLGRRGSMIGNVGRGRIVATKNVSTRGCEVTVLRARKTVCRGRALRFYVFGGTWRVAVRGRGVNLSGVVRGHLRLQGRSGTFSIAGAPERAWPSTPTTFRLRSG